MSDLSYTEIYYCTKTKQNQRSTKQTTKTTRNTRKGVRNKRACEKEHTRLQAVAAPMVNISWNKCDPIRRPRLMHPDRWHTCISPELVPLGLYATSLKFRLSRYLRKSRDFPRAFFRTLNTRKNEECECVETEFTSHS